MNHDRVRWEGEEKGTCRGSDIVLPTFLGRSDILLKNRKYSDFDLERLRFLARRTTIHSAIEHNDVDLVLYMIRNLGISPNTFNKFGRTAVYVATLFRREVILELLLRLGGTDPNGSAYLASSGLTREVYQRYRIKKTGESYEAARLRKEEAIRRGLIKREYTVCLPWSLYMHRFFPRSYHRAILHLLRIPIGYLYLWPYILTFTHSSFFVLGKHSTDAEKMPCHVKYMMMLGASTFGFRRARPSTPKK